MKRGSLADFPGALREFEPGVNSVQIEQNRAERIYRIGRERFDAFEAGTLTPTFTTDDSLIG